MHHEASLTLQRIQTDQALLKVINLVHPASSLMDQEVRKREQQSLDLEVVQEDHDLLQEVVDHGQGVLSLGQLAQNLGPKHRNQDRKVLNQDHKVQNQIIVKVGPDLNQVVLVLKIESRDRDLVVLHLDQKALNQGRIYKIVDQILRIS